MEMEFSEIEEVLKGKEGKVLIRGWLYHKRSFGGILFFNKNKKEKVIQCTLKKEI